MPAAKFDEISYNMEDDKAAKLKYSPLILHINRQYEFFISFVWYIWNLIDLEACTILI